MHDSMQVGAEDEASFLLLLMVDIYCSKHALFYNVATRPWSRVKTIVDKDAGKPSHSVLFHLFGIVVAVHTNAITAIPAMMDQLCQFRLERVTMPAPVSDEHSHCRLCRMCDCGSVHEDNE